MKPSRSHARRATTLAAAALGMARRALTEAVTRRAAAKPLDLPRAKGELVAFAAGRN